MAPAVPPPRSILFRRGGCRNDVGLGLAGTRLDRVVGRQTPLRGTISRVATKEQTEIKKIGPVSLGGRKRSGEAQTAAFLPWKIKDFLYLARNNRTSLWQMKGLQSKHITHRSKCQKIIKVQQFDTFSKAQLGGFPPPFFFSFSSGFPPSRAACFETPPPLYCSCCSCCRLPFSFSATLTW